MTVSTTHREFGSLFKRLEMKRIGALDEGVIKAAQRGAQKLARRALPKFSGRTRSACTVRVYNRGVSHARSTVVCEIIVNVPYAKAIEMGTRPFIPPISPLHDWVVGKLGIPDPEAWGVAYAVRAKIADVGITAQWNIRDFLPELRAMLEPFLREAYAASRAG